MNDSDPSQPPLAAPTDRSPDQFGDPALHAPEAEAPPASPAPPPDPFSFDDDGFDQMFARQAVSKPRIPAPPPVPSVERAAEPALIPPPKSADITIAAPARDPDKEPATWRSKSQPPPDELELRRSAEPRRSEPSRRRAPETPKPAPPSPLPPLPPPNTPSPKPREPAAQLDHDHPNIAEIAPLPTGESQISGEAHSHSLSSHQAQSQNPAATPTAEEIQHQIHDLEARLDQLIRQNRKDPGSGAPESRGTASSKHQSPAPESSPPEDSVTARELLSTDFYLHKWGRRGMKNRSEDVDEFGLDPKYEKRYIPFFDFLHKYYFRVDTQGIEQIPGTGRCLIVSNHSGGTLPYDGVMLRTIIRREHPKARELRWLSEDFIYYLPFIGAAMNRLGAVRACQENAERLLSNERLVAVFPEGAKGIGKLYGDRYKLQRFGRGGFIRLCLRTQTPLIPCAIIGAEEANPMLYRIEYMTKSIGIPYVPITPTFPALGPLGLLPAPTKWKVRFGEPIDFEDYGPEAADDELLVGRLSERVRSIIQGLVDRTLSERRSIWFG